MKKMMFLILALTIFLSACSSNDLPVDNPDKITIYYFWEQGCPSCDLQNDFLDDLSEKYSEVEVKKFDLSIKENEELLRRLAEAYEDRVFAPPITFIAEESLAGFGSAQTTGRLIEDIVLRCISSSCLNPADILRQS